MANPPKDVHLDKNGHTEWSIAYTSGYGAIPIDNYYPGADYSGDDNYSYSYGEGYFQVVKADSLTTILNCPPGPLKRGDAQVFSITEYWQDPPTANLADVPSGSLSVEATSQSGGSPQKGSGSWSSFLGVKPEARVLLTFPDAGSYEVQASYEGDAHFNASTSDHCTVTVQAN